MHALLDTVPYIALFAAIGIGVLIGKPSVKGVSLGPIAGTLIAAVIIGQWHFDISGPFKSIMFALFIYSIGYVAGPGFVHAFSRKAWRQLVQATFIAVVALGHGAGPCLRLQAGSRHRDRVHRRCDHAIRHHRHRDRRDPGPGPAGRQQDRARGQHRHRVFDHLPVRHARRDPDHHLCRPADRPAVARLPARRRWRNPRAGGAATFAGRHCSRNSRPTWSVPTPTRLAASNRSRPWSGRSGRVYRSSRCCGRRRRWPWRAI